MRFLDAVRLAFQTIRAQKLKSGFSVVGVFIGVMFLIAVVSVVEGMNRYMTDKFAGTLLGVNTFRLRQFPDVQLGNVTDSMWRSWMRRPRVTYEDAQAEMREAMSQAEAVMRSRRHLRPRQADDFALETADEVLDFWGKINGILRYALPFLPGISLVVGVVLGAGVGIVAGVYPASRAARLDPITALRAET